LHANRGGTNKSPKN